MSRHLLVAAIVVLAATASGRAEDMPRQLAPELIATEHQYCKTSTGYGRDFTRFVDVDGDGRKDVVLDYAQALCGGQPEPYCASDGCLLKVWVSAGGGWRKVFEGRAERWTVEPHDGRSTLMIDGRPLPR